jgi:uncharacterized protein VirK/YbjX
MATVNSNRASSHEGESSSIRMSLGLAAILAATQSIYPGATPRALSNKLKFLAACIKARPQLRALVEQDTHRALLRQLREQPKTLGFVVWPYIHAGWPMIQRFEALSQHRQALLDDMAILDISPSEAVVVADLSDLSPGLKLIVDRAPWCLREGSLVFSQYIEDDRMMSLAFSLGVVDGARVAYIGSVQGSNLDSALSKYREVAKDLQGLRSRDFLVKSFQYLMYHLGVQRILGVSEERRHHRHRYFGNDKAQELHLNYDQIWQDHSGKLTDDGFYELALLPNEKSMAEIAAKNRALYRRRYEMLGRVKARIAMQLNVSTSESAPES